MVDIELVPTTAGFPHFPFSRFFGLWLLHESATTLVMLHGQPLWRTPESSGGPIAREVSDDELLELTDVETPDEKLLRPPTPEKRRVLRERKEALVERFVRRVSYADVRNWSPMLCEARGGRYFEPAPRTSPRRSEAIDALDAAYARADELGDDRALPSATLRIEATDVRWTSHLEPGLEWDVYAFDSDAGDLL
jgi:hypothetical protein